MHITRTFTERAGAKSVFRLSEHEALISEADHRVSNSLTLLASAVSLRASRLSRERRTMESEEVALLLREIESQIVAVAQVHRLLSRQPTATTVDLASDLHDLGRKLVEALDPARCIELVRTAHEKCPVAKDKVLPVCLIFTELVTNSLKHAHPPGEVGRITVGCRNRADGSITVEVCDDGAGFPQGFDPDKAGGLGLRTVRLLAQRLKAELTHASGPTGACFTLRLPRRDT